MTASRPRPSAARMLAEVARQATPARLFDEGPVAAYSTRAALQLRGDHAAARDAVHRDLDPDGPLARLPRLATVARDREEYLVRPDLGRRLDEPSRERAAELGAGPHDVQVVVGDGLSIVAVEEHAPVVLAGLEHEARERGWAWAPPMLIRQCRVGVLNDLGPVVSAPLIIVLIGERPGLAISDSMSAYFAWRPREGSSDADRNLISNIHDRGVRPAVAARRIAELAALIRTREVSGVGVKEIRAAEAGLPSPPE